MHNFLMEQLSITTSVIQGNFLMMKQQYLEDSLMLSDL